MIRFATVLVVVALGMLGGGAVSSELSLVYLAIVVSAVALVVLGIGVVLKREELFGNRPGLVPAGAGASPVFPVGPAGQDQASHDRTGAPVPPGPVVPAAAEPGVAGVAAPTMPSPVIAAAATTDLFTPRPAPARPASWALPWDVPADSHTAPSTASGPAADAPPAETTIPAPSEWSGWPGQPAGDPSGDLPSAAPPEDEEAPELGLPPAEPPTRAVPVLSEAAVTRATPVPEVAAAVQEASPADTVPVDEASSADEAAEVTAVASAEPAAEADHPADTDMDTDTDAEDSASLAAETPDDLVSPAAEADETPTDTDAVLASAAGLVALIRGVPRYHQPECVLIRFMSDEDIQKLPVSEARAAGCTPCSACQPAEA